MEERRHSSQGHPCGPGSSKVRFPLASLPPQPFSSACAFPTVCRFIHVLIDRALVLPHGRPFSYSAMARFRDFASRAMATGSCGGGEHRAFASSNNEHRQAGVQGLIPDEGALLAGHLS